MEIKKNRNGQKLRLELTGRLDTITAPQLEEVIKNELDGIQDLVIDLKGLAYLSSAGLRVLLLAQKKMNLQGSMTVCNVGDTVMEVLHITGFDEILTIICIQEKEQTFSIEAKTDNLDQVLDFIRRTLEKQECPVRILGQIEVAAEEIFVNIARYAYETGVGDAGIRVEVEQDPLRVAITFMDHGVPYDPLQRENPDTTLSAEERQIGGLGIYMVKKSMDDVCYDYQDGKNILTIRKNLSDRGES